MMQTANLLIRALLPPEVQSADATGLQAGDRLGGRILDVRPDGQARIDFGRFRATAALPLPVQAGDHIVVRVARLGNPLALLLESPVGVPAAGPASPEKLGFPDGAAWQTLGRLARAVPTEAPTADPPPASARLGPILGRLLDRLEPLALKSGTGALAGRLADMLQGSGPLLEKRLEGMLRHLLAGPRTPDAKTLDTHPLIRTVLDADCKSLLVQLKALLGTDAERPGPHPAALRSTLGSLLEDILVQQRRAVQRHAAAGRFNQEGPAAYGSASARAVAARPAAAQIARWVSDLVTVARLGSAPLPADGEAALARLASSAEQMEMLAPAAEGHDSPDTRPIHRLLVHLRTLLATARHGDGAAAVNIDPSRFDRLAEDLDRLGGADGSQRAAAARAVRRQIHRLADNLQRVGSEELDAVAGRLRLLADRLPGEAQASRHLRALARDVMAPALDELAVHLRADAVHAGSSLLAGVEQLQRRLEHHLAEPGSDTPDRPGPGRLPSQVLTFSVPLAGRQDPARIKVYLNDRRRRGEPGQHRIALLLDLDGLGPVRADLQLHRQDLTVRLAVTEGAARQRLEDGSDALRAALAPYFGQVAIQTVLSVPQVQRFETAELEAPDGHALDVQA